jgi:two-component SAPR family response regulator
MLLAVQLNEPVLSVNLATYFSRIGYDCVSHADDTLISQPYIILQNTSRSNSTHNTLCKGIIELSTHKNTPYANVGTLPLLTLALPIPLETLAKHIKGFIHHIHDLQSEVIVLHPQLSLNLRSKKLTNESQNLTCFVTEREAEILTYLHHCHEDDTRRKALLEHVWKYHSDTDTHTLETHMYRLRQKLLETGNKLEIIHDQSGYKLLPTP